MRRSDVLGRSALRRSDVLGRWAVRRSDVLGRWAWLAARCSSAGGPRISGSAGPPGTDSIPAIPIASAKLAIGRSGDMEPESIHGERGRRWCASRLWCLVVGTEPDRTQLSAPAMSNPGSSGAMIDNMDH